MSWTSRLAIKLQDLAASEYCIIYIIYTSFNWGFGLDVFMTKGVKGKPFYFMRFLETQLALMNPTMPHLTRYCCIKYVDLVICRVSTFLLCFGSFLPLRQNPATLSSKSGNQELSHHTQQSQTASLRVFAFNLSAVDLVEDLKEYESVINQGQALSFIKDPSHVKNLYSTKYVISLAVGA